MILYIGFTDIIEKINYIKNGMVKVNNKAIINKNNYITN